MSLKSKPVTVGELAKLYMRPNEEALHYTVVNTANMKEERVGVIQVHPYGIDVMHWMPDSHLDVMELARGLQRATWPGAKLGSVNVCVCQEPIDANYVTVETEATERDHVDYMTRRISGVHIDTAKKGGVYKLFSGGTQIGFAAVGTARWLADANVSYVMMNCNTRTAWNLHDMLFEKPAAETE